MIESTTIGEVLNRFVQHSPTSYSANPQISVSDNEILKQYFQLKIQTATLGYNQMEDWVKKKASVVVAMANAENPNALLVVSDDVFLRALVNTARYIIFDNDDLMKFNRIARAYINNTSSRYYTKERSQLFLECGHIFNETKVNLLVNVGVPLNDAIWIVINRYSSTDERVNIKRLVRTIQRMNIKVMTEQRIADIFQRLCNDSMTNLFCGVMEDRFTKFYNDMEHELYSTVSNVVLYLMEHTMGASDMEKIFHTYINEIKSLNKRGRFHLMSINSEDYPKINYVLEKMDAEGVEIV